MTDLGGILLGIAALAGGMVLIVFRTRIDRAMTRAQRRWYGPIGKTLEKHGASVAVTGVAAVLLGAGFIVAGFAGRFPG